MPPNHSSFDCSPQPASCLRAQLEHGDLVRLGVGEQPFVRVQAVVALLRMASRPRRSSRRTAAPCGCAIGQRHALDVEPRLVDGRLADEQAGVVQVIIHAALNAAGVRLHEHAVALGRLARRARRCRSRAGYRLNMVMWPKTILPSAVAGPVAAKALQCSAFAAGIVLGFGRCQSQAFEAGRRRFERVVERLDLGPAVERDDVDQVDRPPSNVAPAPRPRRRCPSSLRGTPCRTCGGTGR